MLVKAVCRSSNHTRQHAMQVVMAVSGMKKGVGRAQPVDVDLDRIVGYHSDEDSIGEQVVNLTRPMLHSMHSASIADVSLWRSICSSIVRALLHRQRGMIRAVSHHRRTQRQVQRCRKRGGPVWAARGRWRHGQRCHQDADPEAYAQEGRAGEALMRQSLSARDALSGICPDIALHVTTLTVERHPS